MVFGKSKSQISGIFNDVLEKIKKNFCPHWIGFSVFDRTQIDMCHIPRFFREVSAQMFRIFVQKLKIKRDFEIKISRKFLSWKANAVSNPRIEV